MYIHNTYVQYTCMCIIQYTYTHTCICTYCTYILCMYSTYVCVSYSMYTCTHAYKRGPCSIYIHVYIRTYVRTYICMYNTHSTYSGSGISMVGVVSLQWEWHLYSGSGTSTVGVASLKSVWDYTFTSTRPVPYLQLHMHSNHQYFTPDNPVK